MGERGRYKHRRNILLPFVAAVMVLAAAAAAFKIVLVPGIENNKNIADTATSVGSSQSVSTSVSSSISSSVSQSSAASTVSVSASGYDYFKDAVFVGDSITAGITQYKVVPATAGIITSNGLSTYSALNTKLTVDGNKMLVADAVASKKAAKVYILLGSNDLTWMSSDTFISNYQKLIKALQKSSGNLKIYVQSVFPVTAAYEKKEKLSNSKIDTSNQALEKMCGDNGVTYLDVEQVLKGSDGKLPASASSDGFNLKSSYYTKWFDYLASHE